MKAAQMYKYLFAVGAFMIPMGLAFLADNVRLIYLIVLASVAGVQILVSIFSIYSLSLIQQQTPNELLGKVMAYIATITLCAQPLGQMMYGILFDAFSSNIIWIMVGSAACIMLISLMARNAFLYYGYNDK